jgi:hypothetical protein
VLGEKRQVVFKSGGSEERRNVEVTKQALDSGVDGCAGGG